MIPPDKDEELAGSQKGRDSDQREEPQAAEINGHNNDGNQHNGAQNTIDQHVPPRDKQRTRRPNRVAGLAAQYTTAPCGFKSALRFGGYKPTEVRNRRQREGARDGSPRNSVRPAVANARTSFAARRMRPKHGVAPPRRSRANR